MITLHRSFRSVLAARPYATATNSRARSTAAADVCSAPNSRLRRQQFRPMPRPDVSSRYAPRRLKMRKRITSGSGQMQKPTIPKLPPAGPQLLPMHLKTGSHPLTNSTSRNNGQYGARMLEFLKLNGPVLLLNFGSLCTLAGFTRTDVLELRIGNLIGNCTGMTYMAYKRQIPPFFWAAIFGLTNAYNIYLILEERSDSVVLSKKEQDIYTEHFLPHGLTPKQFHKLMERGEEVHYKKGEKIISHLCPLDSVYLVVNGRTKATILGRHLTYASSLPGNSLRQKGGDSGAWIGEIAFLDNYWNKDSLRRKKSQKRTEEFVTVEDADDGEEDDNIVKQRPFHHTVVCEEDATVYKWSHAKLESLMKESSHDLRKAMTRALTSAVVGKVVNFTVSRGKEAERVESGHPGWSEWLREGSAEGQENVVAEDQKNAIEHMIAMEEGERLKQRRKESSATDVERPKKTTRGRKVGQKMTRLDAIDAFREVLLGEQAMDVDQTSLPKTVTAS